MGTVDLQTQSFVLKLDENTFAPIKITLANAELRELYEDDLHKTTTALIRELAWSLKASKEINAELEHKLNKLTEEYDDVYAENTGLRSDNEMLRDELDAS